MHNLKGYNLDIKIKEIEELPKKEKQSSKVQTKLKCLKELKQEWVVAKTINPGSKVVKKRNSSLDENGIKLIGIVVAIAQAGIRPEVMVDWGGCLIPEIPSNLEII